MVCNNNWYQETFKKEKYLLLVNHSFVNKVPIIKEVKVNKKKDNLSFFNLNYKK